MEEFPTKSKIVGEIDSFRRQIEIFKSGDISCGKPAYDFYRVIIHNRHEWLSLHLSRNRPVCLSCGNDDVEPISQELVQTFVGDIGISHGVCGGRLIGSFYKSPYPNILLSPDRLDREAPIKFNEYSVRGHIKDSFYYNLYEVMESEIIAIVSNPGHEKEEQNETKSKWPDFENWMRAFVRAELEYIPLTENEKKVYKLFPDLMTMIESRAREEIAKFRQQARQYFDQPRLKSGSDTTSLWKKLFG
jgi:hypothetical protein